MSKYYSVHAEKVKFSSTTSAFLKFGDGDGPNLCRVKSKKVDVSSTFIENIFQSGLTHISSNDIVTIKIDKKNFKM